MDNRKHIRMKRAAAQTWLAALRSGEYPKTTETLYRAVPRPAYEGVVVSTAELPAGYCCLGVLQKALTGTVEELDVPSMEWLEANEIEFYIDASEKYNVPYMHLFDTTLSVINDTKDLTFPQMADLIEQELEYTDE